MRSTSGTAHLLSVRDPERSSAGRSSVVARISAMELTERRVFAAVVTLCGSVTAAMIGYELSRPHVLMGIHGYDPGAYFGATLQLLHGVVPYRDFYYEHPPGLPLFLPPFMVLGQLGGDRVAMVIARALTGVFSGCQCHPRSSIDTPLGVLDPLRLFSRGIPGIGRRRSRQPDGIARSKSATAVRLALRNFGRRWPFCPLLPDSRLLLLIPEDAALLGAT